MEEIIKHKGRKKTPLKGLRKAKRGQKEKPTLGLMKLECIEPKTKCRMFTRSQNEAADHLKRNKRLTSDFSVVMWMQEDE